MKPHKLTANIYTRSDLKKGDDDFIDSLYIVLNCIDILFETGKNDNLFPISENYFYNKIIDILKQGTFKLDKNSKIKIARQIKKIEIGIYDMCSISYNYSHEKDVELIFGKIFSPDNADKKLYGGVLGVVDYELSKTVDKFDNLSQKIYEDFEFKTDRSFYDIKSDFRCMDVVTFAGELNRKEKPISVFYSGGGGEQISSLSKVAVFSNVYLHRFKIISGELGKKLIKDFIMPNDEILKQILICWLRGHDLGHSFGADNLGSKMKDCRKDYYILHELKSDIISLYLLKRISDELFNKDIIRQVYLVFVAEMLRYVRRGNFYKLPDSGSAYLAYKYLCQSNAFVFSESSLRYSLNFEKFDDFIESFSKDLINLFSEGNKDRALEFVNKFDGINHIESKDLSDELTFIEDNSIPYYLELVANPA